MSLKFNIPLILKGLPFGKQTPTKWLLLRLVNNPIAFRDKVELLIQAKVAALVPVSNAWPERGASA